jgi:hypothetical protein
VLRITSLVVQNPNDDRGSASFAVGDSQLLEWSLAFVAPTIDQPFPLDVPAGGVVHFVVTCTQVGSTTATSGSCQPGLTIVGEQVPAG